MTNLQEKPLYISAEEKKGITQELLREYFDYKDGFLFWKKVKSNNIKIGQKAGYINKLKDGIERRMIAINNKMCIASRLIFCWHHGYFPKEVDHIDHDMLNNKIENLRAATRNQNLLNRRSYKNSASKYKGVYWNKLAKKWQVNIGINGKCIHIGYFDDEDEAGLARNEYTKKYNDLEFAIINVIE